VAVTEPINQLHKTLRALTEQDPSCERAIAWASSVIQLRGYATVMQDPGMAAWIAENQNHLKVIADARRAAYGRRA